MAHVAWVPGDRVLDGLLMVCGVAEGCLHELRGSRRLPRTRNADQDGEQLVGVGLITSLITHINDNVLHDNKSKYNSSKDLLGLVVLQVWMLVAVVLLVVIVGGFINYNISNTYYEEN